MKYWEIIVNKIIKAGFSVGWVSALDDYGRTVWTVDAHREGKRFVVNADEKLTAFMETGIGGSLEQWARPHRGTNLAA
jgi:hypothetical protein